MKETYLEIIRKFNHNHGKDGKFCEAEQAVGAAYTSPKKAGKSVGWINVLSKAKTVDDVADIVEEYMPGAMTLAKTVCEKQMKDRSYSERDIFSEVCRTTGYGDKPNAVSHDDFEKLLSNGGTEYFTDFAVCDTNDIDVSDFVSGSSHKGFDGEFGFGTYARKGKQKLYDDARFTLDKKATIGDSYDIEKDLDKFKSALEAKMKKVSGSEEDEKALADGRYSESKSFLIGSVLSEDLSTNIGTYAALRGYDAITPAKDADSSVLVVLNRSAVTIDKASIEKD